MLQIWIDQFQVPAMTLSAAAAALPCKFAAFAPSDDVHEGWRLLYTILVRLVDAMKILQMLNYRSRQETA